MKIPNASAESLETSETRLMWGDHNISPAGRVTRASGESDFRQICEDMKEGKGRKVVRLDDY